MNERLRPPAFVSCAAQDDNLGDLVIRRTAVRWIEDAGLEPHVLVSGVGEGFVDGLDLRPGAVTYGGIRPWVRALLAHSRRQPTTLVYPPGPQSLKISLRNVGHALANAGMAADVSSHGGSVVKLGRAIEPGSPLMLGLERFLAGRCSLYSVRDEKSHLLLDDATVRVEPDLAWAGGLEQELDQSQVVERTRLAMSFRADRSFDRKTIEVLVTQAASRGLIPTFVTQVKRDDQLHQTLAAELGCEIVSWPADRTDRAQLRAVLRTYQQSAMVVSNRLHGVIFGMVAGAVPVGLATAGDTKIARTLGVVGLAHHVLAEAPVPDRLWDADPAPALQQAIQRLEAVENDFAALVPAAPEADLRAG